MVRDQTGSVFIGKLVKLDGIADRQVGVRKRHAAILLIAIRPGPGRLAHENRTQLVSKVSGVRHAGRKCPTAGDREKSSAFEKLLSFFYGFHEVVAAAGEIAA